MSGGLGECLPIGPGSDKYIVQKNYSAHRQPGEWWRLINYCYRLWLFPLGDQAAGTIVQFPPQSRYSNIELTSPGAIIAMLITRLGSLLYIF